MELPKSPEIRLCEAIAAILHTNQLGTYKPALPYTPAEHGILIDRSWPTTLNNCTIITPYEPVLDGRSNVIYRVQLLTRLRDQSVRDWAFSTAGLFHHTEYTPNILGISWCEEYSRAYFDADTQQRTTVSQNFSFRGRQQTP